MPETWEGSYETDLAMRRPIEAQFQHILNFIQNHDDLLHRVDEKRNNLFEEKTPYRSIRIALDAPERVTPYDMLYNDNDKNSSVRKTLMVLVFLSDEIHELKEIAEERFFPLLVIFGRSPLDNEGQTSIFQHSFFTVSTSTLPRTFQFSILTAICLPLLLFIYLLRQLLYLYPPTVIFLIGLHNFLSSCHFFCQCLLILQSVK